jgi:type III secretion protein N (ATPase)
MSVLDRLSESLARLEPSTHRRQGEVHSVRGTLVIAHLPSTRVGELCHIERRDAAPLPAEVVGFVGGQVKLMALGPLTEVESGAIVVATGASPQVACGDGVVGRVLDALGRPFDGGGLIGETSGGRTPRVSLMAPPPKPMERARITTPLRTGVRVIDTLLTVGIGQRVGIFAGPGVGKSKLLSKITREVDADLVVLALIGERGREVREFVESDLCIGASSANRPDSPPAVVVVSTSDEPALLRLKAAHTATAIAEHARAEGKRVVLMMDSLTRFARALREVGLAADEPPGRGGFPASVFAELPRLVERAGNDARGSITAFYTVLRESEYEEDVVASEVKSLLDGHIMLSPKLADAGHYPAVDLLASRSRLFGDLATTAQKDAARRIRSALATYTAAEAQIACGAYRRDDPRINQAIDLRPRIAEFLRQDERERSEWDNSQEWLVEVASELNEFAS